MNSKKDGKTGKKRKKSKGQNDSLEKPSKVQQSSVQNTQTNTISNDKNVNKNKTVILTNSTNSELSRPDIMNTLMPIFDSPMIQSRPNYQQIPTQQPVQNPHLPQSSPSAMYYPSTPQGGLTNFQPVMHSTK